MAALRFTLLRAAMTLSVVLVGGCSDNAGSAHADDLPLAHQVQVEFSAALKPGDSAEKIEAFLGNRGLGFSYDEFQNRYQAVIRSEKTDFHAIQIYVNVDAEKRFLSVEAFDSYTMP